VILPKSSLPTCFRLCSAKAILRFWALGLCLYQYLDSLRHRLERIYDRHLTLGETLAWLRQRHVDLALEWICQLSATGIPFPVIHSELKPALPPVDMSNC
jgi:hypothetical protein